MILKKKVFGSAMLAAAIMSAGTCTAMAAPQQENTAIEAESENSTQTAAGLALKITEGFQNADEQASIEKKESRFWKGLWLKASSFSWMA